MKEQQYDLIGAGNAITDLLIEVEDAFLTEHIDGEKGGMELAEIEVLESLIAACPSRATIAPGGAAANTVRTAAHLGVNCKFLGMLGNDQIGEYYLEAFADSGCDTSAFRRHAERASGQCLSIITPDKERTMRTYLGAAIELASVPLTIDDFAGCAILYVEGYLLFNRELMLKIMRLGKAAGCRIAMDLGSFEVVRASMDILPGILGEYIDIVFANEDEASAFSGCADLEASLAALAELCEVAVVKLGDEGAWIRSDGQTIVVEPVPQPELVDTTGAGDLWAAGFFYGLAHGLAYEHCGAIGAILGSAAVSELGTSIPAAKWDLIERDIASIVARAQPAEVQQD